MSTPRNARTDIALTRREFVGALAAGLGMSALAAEAIVPSDGSEAAAAAFNTFTSQPTLNSVAMNVLPPITAPWAVEWGSTPENLDNRTEQQPPAIDPVNLIIDRLEPATRYYYRVRAASAEHQPDAALGTFTTQRPAGQSYVFTLTTDSHLAPNQPRKVIRPIFDKVMASAIQEAPDFHITLGDEAMVHGMFAVASSQDDADAIYTHLRRRYADLARAAPFFYVLGNHEAERWTGQGFGFSKTLATYARTARHKYVPGPHNDTYPQGGSQHGNYFAWTWGDALFVALDPYAHTPVVPARPEDWTLGPDQLAWLENVLRSAKQKWKIILQHQLVGGSPLAAGAYGPYGQYPNYGRGGASVAHVGEQAKIHRLMKQYGAQLVLKGHDHIFADETHDGVRYTTCGRLSGRSPDGPPWADNSGFRELYPNGFDGAWGYMRFAVAPESVNVQFKGTDGRTRADYTIR